MDFSDFYCMRNGVIINPPPQGYKTWLQGMSYYHTHNKERALLLLHGFASTPAVYRTFFPILTQHYDAVVCPVLPGHGQSVAVFAASTPTHWRNMAALCYQKLAEEYTSIDVLGLSMGGLLALELAQHYPVHHLYLLAPALNLHLKLSPVLSALKILSRLGFSRIRSKGGNINNPAQSEITYRQLPIPTIIALLNYIKHFKLHIPSCPAHLFLGMDDAVVDSAKIYKRFHTAKHVQRLILPRSAHVLPLDYDYARILDTIVENLRKL